MDCAKKKDLQQKCTAAWEAFDAAATKLPFPVHSLTGLLAFQPANEDGTRGPCADAISSQRAYARASRALSRHLADHRC